MWAMRVLFWIGKAGLFSSLIRVFKRRGISHVEIKFSDGIAGTALPGTGIVLRPLPEGDGDWFDIPIPCTPEQEALVRQFFLTEANCGYDWLGIIFCQVFGWTLRSKTKWFCSEACLTALLPVFPELRTTPAYRVDPAELSVLLEHCLKARAGSVGPIG